MNSFHIPLQVISINKLLKRAKHLLYLSKPNQDLSEIELSINIALLTDNITEKQKLKGQKLLSLINFIKTGGGGNEENNAYLIYNLINHYRQSPHKDISGNYLRRLCLLIPKYTTMVKELSKINKDYNIYSILCNSIYLKIKNKEFQTLELPNTINQILEYYDIYKKKKNWAIEKIINEQEVYIDMWVDPNNLYEDNSIIGHSVKGIKKSNHSSWVTMADKLTYKDKKKDDDMIAFVKDEDNDMMNSDKEDDCLLIMMLILVKDFIEKDKIYLLKPRYLRIKKDIPISILNETVKRILKYYSPQEQNINSATIHLIKKEQKDLLAKIMIAYKANLSTFYLKTTEIQKINDQSSNMIFDEDCIIVEVPKANNNFFLNTSPINKCNHCSKEINDSSQVISCKICSYVSNYASFNYI